MNQEKKIEIILHLYLWFWLLLKNLKKLDFTEEKAFKLIYNDFWRKNPSKDNWKKVFQEVFNITLENFYLSLKNYTNDISSVLPSKSLKLENIFYN